MNDDQCMIEAIESGHTQLWDSMEDDNQKFLNIHFNTKLSCIVYIKLHHRQMLERMYDYCNVYNVHVMHVCYWWRKIVVIAR